MITITNGSRTTKVTGGAFKDIYEPMGWKIADLSEESGLRDTLLEEVEKTAETKVEELQDTSEEVDYFEEDPEVEIPLSEMKVAELRQYAAKHDIDVSAAKKRKDIIDIIKAEMEE